MSNSRQIFMDELANQDTSNLQENLKNNHNWEPPEDKILLGFDFQGWPIYAQKFKEILKELGFKDDGEKVFLTHNEMNDVLLESYPKILSDDGMGYGVGEEYICETDNDIYEDIIGDKNVSVFNVFIEKYTSEN